MEDAPNSRLLQQRRDDEIVVSEFGKKPVVWASRRLEAHEKIVPALLRAMRPNYIPRDPR